MTLEASSNQDLSRAHPSMEPESTSKLQGDHVEERSILSQSTPAVSGREKDTTAEEEEVAGSSSGDDVNVGGEPSPWGALHSRAHSPVHGLSSTNVDEKSDEEALDLGTEGLLSQSDASAKMLMEDVARDDSNTVDIPPTDAHSQSRGELDSIPKDRFHNGTRIEDGFVIIGSKPNPAPSTGDEQDVADISFSRPVPEPGVVDDPLSSATPWVGINPPADEGGGSAYYAPTDRKNKPRSLIPRSAYYYGPPPQDSAYGTLPVGQIGHHHPREILRVERDYSGGELAQFATVYPIELEGRVTPTQFLETINAINELLISAHSLHHSFFDNLLAVATLYLSRLLFTTHYEREMRRLERLIQDLNTELYNPVGLNILWPRNVAFLFLEIEYY